MGVPFEALLPYAIIVGFFGVTGVGLGFIRAVDNGGKRGRFRVDQWDRQSTTSADVNRSPQTNMMPVMERDRRLTGFLRGQIDRPLAPEGFELLKTWKLERRP